MVFLLFENRGFQILDTTGVLACPEYVEWVQLYLDVGIKPAMYRCKFLCIFLEPVVHFLFKPLLHRINLSAQLGSNILAFLLDKARKTVESVLFLWMLSLCHVSEHST